MTPYEELLDLAPKLDEAASTIESDIMAQPIDALEEAVNEVGRSFSGSWLGYHSCVYYADLSPAPPGANFSQEWGLKELLSDMGSLGDWREFDPEDVKAQIYQMAGEPDLDASRDAAGKSQKLFNSSKSEILSILTSELDERGDEFLAKLKDDLEKVEPLSKGDFAEHWRPKGQIMTRDTLAAGQRSQLPPHIDVLAEVASIRHSFGICKEAAEISRKAASHLERKNRQRKVDDSTQNPELKRWMINALRLIKSIGDSGPKLFMGIVILTAPLLVVFGPFEIDWKALLGGSFRLDKVEPQTNESAVLLELSRDVNFEISKLSVGFGGRPLIATGWKLVLVNRREQSVTLLQQQIWQRYNGVKSFHGELVQALRDREGNKLAFPLTVKPGESLLFKIEARAPLAPSLVPEVDAYLSQCDDQASLVAFEVFLAYKARKDLFGNSAEGLGEKDYIDTRDPCSAFGGFTVLEQRYSFSLIVSFRTSNEEWISIEETWR